MRTIEFRPPAPPPLPYSSTIRVAAAAADESGFSVSGGFDMNGDGLSDFIIGAPEGGTIGEFDGEAYVVFGQVWEKCVSGSQHARTTCWVGRSTVFMPSPKSTKN